MLVRAQVGTGRLGGHSGSVSQLSLARAVEGPGHTEVTSPPPPPPSHTTIVLYSDHHHPLLPLLPHHRSVTELVLGRAQYQPPLNTEPWTRPVRADD